MLFTNSLTFKYLTDSFALHYVKHTVVSNNINHTVCESDLVKTWHRTWNVSNSTFCVQPSWSK